MESIARVSSLLESARDLTIDAAASARSSRSSQKNVPAAQIKKLLDSRHEREILEGLRKVISMMCQSQLCLPFFSAVVKNVASPNLEIKKLVYIYLVNHAEAEPDLALLSINTIQKSLSDTNPQVRALALKTMSGIRVPVISQIVSLAIKKGLGDMSAHVRKTAALAIPKCYRLEPNTLPQLLDYLSILIGDKQYYVAGAAVRAFLEICPDRMDLIHKHYRGLVRKIVDMDEWSQLTTLRLMTIYARKSFPRRTRTSGKTEHKGFYDGDDGDDDAGEEEKETEETVHVLDPDLELLLKSIKPLLQSRNSAVIVAVIRCYINLATPEYMEPCIGPLVALLRAPQDIQQIALYNIVAVCMLMPQAFVKYATHFLVHVRETAHIWGLKLEILTLIFPHCDPYMKSIILNELEHFSRGSDRDLVRESVRAIGRCAQSDPRTSARCMQLLFKQVTSPDGNLVAESLTVIRHLIQQNPDAHTNTVIRLAKNLDTASDPQARATIIWLVGEFAGVGGENNIAADVLRILVKGFADEAEPAKLQIILLAAKVYLHHLNFSGPATPPEAPIPQTHSYALPETEEAIGGGGGFEEFNTTTAMSNPEEKVSPPDHPIIALWNHILLLARYDTSYDLRDRTRLYKALLAVPSSTQLASLMLLAPKPVPHTPSPSECRKGLTLGSASLVLGMEGGVFGLKGYEALPDWVEEGREPRPELRDEGDGEREYEARSGSAAGLLPASERLDAMMKDQGINRSVFVNKKVVNGAAGSLGNGKEKSLDDWLAEDEEEDEEEEGENGEEDEGEEESEEEEEGSEEEEDDDGDDDDDDGEDENESDGGEDDSGTGSVSSSGGKPDQRPLIS